MRHAAPSYAISVRPTQRVFAMRHSGLRFSVTRSEQPPPVADDVWRRCSDHRTRHAACLIMER